MKKEDMYNAVSSISPDILDKVDAYMATKKTSKTIRWKRWIAAAACFCLLIAGFFATKNNQFTPNTSNTANLPGSFLMDISQQDKGSVNGNYQVLLSNNADSQGDASSVYLVSTREGLRLSSAQNISNVFAAYVAPGEAREVVAESMSIEEAKKYAYLDYDSASPEMREKILAARNVIIYSTDWVADGYSGCIQDVETGETIKTLPTFSELFPGWDMPVTDTTKADVTEDGLGGDALYGLMLQVLEINESGIVCSSSEPMNMFSPNQIITVTPPEGITMEELSLKVGDTIFVSYFGKNCSISAATIQADSIAKQND